MWALLKFEAVKLLKSKMIYIGFLMIFGLVTMIFVGFQWRKLHPRQDKHKGAVLDSREFLSAPQFVSWVESPTVIFLIPMFVSVVGSSMVAGESRAGTLRTMLIRPVSRTQVLGAKAAMVLAFTVAVLGLTVALSFAVGFSQFEPRGKMIIFSQKSEMFFYLVPKEYSLERTLWSLVLTLPGLMSVAMLALMFSVMFRQAATAAMATMGVYYTATVVEDIPMSAMEVVQPFLPTHYMYAWRWPYYPMIVDGKQVWDTMDWDRIGSDLTGLAVFTTGYVVVTLWVFLKKDIES